MSEHWWERLKRWWCRRVGHTWVHDDRGSPAIPLFAICRRCGKWSRMRLEDP